MPSWEPPTDWYLDQFSNEDEWKRQLDAEMVARVEGLISVEAIDAIAEELCQNGCPADQGKLGNLLRHWAQIELSKTVVLDHREHLKHRRDSAVSLAKAMLELKARLDAPMADVAHNASRYVQHQFRISYTSRLFFTLRHSLEELLPAVWALSEEKLPRGRPADTAVKVSIETLLEIFEYVTGKHAGRTYDPIQGVEIGAFSQFARSVLEALHGDEAPPTDSAVRTVLAERMKREAALPEHMRPFDDD